MIILVDNTLTGHFPGNMGVGDPASYMIWLINGSEHHTHLSLKNLPLEPTSQTLLKQEEDNIQSGDDFRAVM